MTNSSAALDLASGSSLGRYELLLPIAKGGMAQVWAARLHGTRGFQKVVAIKTILSGVIDDARMEQMFLDEALIASQIHHPNVVGTIDLGEHEGNLYLVMDWVDGESLNQVMAKAAAHGGVPLAIGVNLIGQACKGLFAAHNLRDEHGDLLGVVHRDVSPQNVLVTYTGTAKLVDFGIAKATSRASAATEVGEVKGKFAYMAPEQVRALAVDNRTDLFALGILLYLITTGKHPFRGENPAETVQNICSERAPTPPSAVVRDYPAELEAVVMTALAKNPSQRFANANDMLTALEAAMPGPLEASFDLQVSDYLHWLFGARSTERRTALRAAQGRVDQQRAESLSSISLGTLRTIAVDNDCTASFRVEPSLLPAGPAPPALPAPPRRANHAVVGLTVALTVAVGGLVLQWAQNSSSSRAAASPSAGVAIEVVSRPAESARTVAMGGAPPSLDASATSKAGARGDTSNGKKKIGSEHKAQRSALPPTASAAAQVSALPPTISPPSVAISGSASAPPLSSAILGQDAIGARE